MSLAFFIVVATVFLLLLSLNCTAAQNGAASDSTCTCIEISSNGNVCLQYSCTTTQRTPACFAGKSLALTDDGSMKSLSNITIGDRVLVLDEQNNLVFEPIYAFIHMKRNGLFDFLSIDVRLDNSTTSLLVSPNHLVFLSNETNTRFAGQLRIGDRLKCVRHHQILAGEITNVRLTQEQGYYAPLTRSGTIVIDNVVASNYATVNNHQLAHRVMHVYRWWIGLFGANQNEENVHWLVRTIETMARWYGIEKFSGTLIYDNAFLVSSLI